jgi:hypothetical protein
MPGLGFGAMPRRWVLWALFLSSYTPLFFLVSLRSIGSSEVLALAGGILTFAGLVGTGFFLVAVRKKTSGRYQLIDVENRDPDVTAYAATYLLPFLTVFSGTWQDLLSLAAFVLILGVVYVRSRLIYVNPLLALFGYRLWRVIPITDGATNPPAVTPWPRFLLIRNAQVRKGQRIEAWRATTDLMLFKSSLDRDDD